MEGYQLESLNPPASSVQASSAQNPNNQASSSSQESTDTSSVFILPTSKPTRRTSIPISARGTTSENTVVAATPPTNTQPNTLPGVATAASSQIEHVADTPGPPKTRAKIWTSKLKEQCLQGFNPTTVFGLIITILAWYYGMKSVELARKEACRQHPVGLLFLTPPNILITTLDPSVRYYLTAESNHILHTLLSI